MLNYHDRDPLDYGEYLLQREGTIRPGVLPADEPQGGAMRGCVYALVVPVGGILAAYGGISLLIDILSALGLLGR